MHYEAHLKAQGRPDVVVDLSGVGFAGSAALGNFVALQRLVRSKGGRIVFCEVDPTVTEVFRASKLDSLFEFVADRAPRSGDHDAAIPDERLPRRRPDRAEDGPPAENHLTTALTMTKRGRLVAVERQACAGPPPSLIAETILL